MVRGGGRTPRWWFAGCGAAVVGLTLCALGGPVAAAPDGYPGRVPVPTTLPPAAGPQIIEVGQSGTAELCGLPLLNSVLIAVNDHNTGTGNTTSNGCVALIITVQTAQTGPHISVNGGLPVLVPYGVNEIEVSTFGPNPIIRAVEVLTHVPNSFARRPAPRSPSTATPSGPAAERVALVRGGLVFVGLR